MTLHQQQAQQDPLLAARLRQAKEKTNTDSKSEERGILVSFDHFVAFLNYDYFSSCLLGDYQMVAAGRPSDRTERRPSYAGRRSRRNSLTDDSQLTIENFGGSQDHLNLIVRLDKEQRDRNSTTSLVTTTPAVAVRSSLQDARGSLKIGYDDGDVEQPEKQDRDTEKIDGLADAGPSVGLDSNAGGIVNAGEDLEANKKTTTFGAHVNTTTWQQQSVQMQKPNPVGE